jgi:Glu-tRNA(Gln) amidotransferase subunit E-like FAD-binding protein
MNTILKIDRPEIIGLFRKMTNEQVGKIIRAYLNNNPKDLIEEEKQIYTELTRHKELRKKSNKEKVVKSWETRKANRETNNKLQAQAQKDKDEINRLKAENENLKKSKQQQYYNSNWNNNNWKKKEEEPPKPPPREPVKTAVGWDL